MDSEYVLIPPAPVCFETQRDQKYYEPANIETEPKSSIYFNYNNFVGRECILCIKCLLNAVKTA